MALCNLWLMVRQSGARIADGTAAIGTRQNSDMRVGLAGAQMPRGRRRRAARTARRSTASRRK